MRHTMSLLALALAGLGCSGEAAAPAEIQYSLRGTWLGVAANGVSVEMEFTSEGDECCLRFASGQGRIITVERDTLDAGLLGINQLDFDMNRVDEVVVTFGGAGHGQPMFGQFSGQFADAVRLEGLMIGPEAFGNPPAGPFGSDSVPIQLRRD